MINQLKNPIVIVSVTTLVLLLNVGGWSTSTRKRIFVLIPERSAAPKNGMIPIKIRTVVERDINHIKDNLCLAGRRTQNENTLHADLILAGITQLITVVLADKINHHEYIRSIKPLIA